MMDAVDKIIFALKEEVRESQVALQDRNKYGNLLDAARRENQDLKTKISTLEGSISGIECRRKIQKRSSVFIDYQQGMYRARIGEREVKSPTLAGVVRKLVNRYPEVAMEMRHV